MATDATRKPLTDAQQRVFDVIERWHTEHGHAPTIREIGDTLNLRSNNGIREHVNALICKGWLRRANGKWRGLELTSPISVPCPTCHGTGRTPAPEPTP